MTTFRAMRVMVSVYRVGSLAGRQHVTVPLDQRVRRRT